MSYHPSWKNRIVLLKLSYNRFRRNGILLTFLHSNLWYNLYTKHTKARKSELKEIERVALEGRKRILQEVDLAATVIDVGGVSNHPIKDPFTHRPFNTYSIPMKLCSVVDLKDNHCPDKPTVVGLTKSGKLVTLCPRCYKNYNDRGLVVIFEKKEIENGINYRGIYAQQKKLDRLRNAPVLEGSDSTIRSMRLRCIKESRDNRQALLDIFGETD